MSRIRPETVKNESLSKITIVPKINQECRICLQSEVTQNDELRAPCKCEGSVKYVHLSCLKKWIS